MEPSFFHNNIYMKQSLRSQKEFNLRYKLTSSFIVKCPNSDCNHAKSLENFNTENYHKLICSACDAKSPYLFLPYFHHLPLMVQGESARDRDFAQTLFDQSEEYLSHRYTLEKDETVFKKYFTSDSELIMEESDISSLSQRIMISKLYDEVYYVSKKFLWVYINPFRSCLGCNVQDSHNRIVVNSLKNDSIVPESIATNHFHFLSYVYESSGIPSCPSCSNAPLHQHEIDYWEEEERLRELEKDEERDQRHLNFSQSGYYEGDYQYLQESPDDKS